MTGHRKWAQVRSSGPSGPSPDQRVQARAEIDAEIANYQLTLAQLRQAKNLTQVALAEGLGVTQGQVSRLEHQADLYLSSLRSYVRQLGGELQLRAAFGQGEWAEIVLGDPDHTEDLGPPSDPQVTAAEVVCPWCHKEMVPRRKLHGMICSLCGSFSADPDGQIVLPAMEQES